MLERSLYTVPFASDQMKRYGAAPPPTLAVRLKVRFICGVSLVAILGLSVLTIV